MGEPGVITGPDISARGEAALGCIGVVLLNTAMSCNKNVIKAACISFSSIISLSLFICMRLPWELVILNTLCVIGLSDLVNII